MARYKYATLNDLFSSTYYQTMSTVVDGTYEPPSGPPTPLPGEIGPNSKESTRTVVFYSDVEYMPGSVYFKKGEVRKLKVFQRDGQWCTMVGHGDPIWFGKDQVRVYEA